MSDKVREQEVTCSNASLRQELLRRMTVACLVAVVVSYPIVLLRTLDLGFRPINAIQSLVVCLMLAVFLARKRLAAGATAAGTLLALLVWLMTAIGNYGVLAPSHLVIPFVTVFSSIAFGRRVALWSFVVSTLGVALIAAFYLSGAMHYHVEVRWYVQSWTSWLVLVVTQALLALWYIFMIAPLQEASYHLSGRMDAILQGMNDALVIHDKDSGAILQVNQKMCAMFGCSAAEALRLTVGELSSGKVPYDLAHLKAWIAKTVNEGSQLFEWQVKDCEGRAFWAELNMRLVNLDGTLWVLTVVRDVSARKQAERELREVQSNLSVLIESTDDLIWSVDLDGRYLTFNRRVQEYIREVYGTEIRVGARPEECMPQERAAFWLSLFKRVLAEGPSRQEMHLSNGKVHALALNPIVNGGETVGVSVFAKDITERKRAEEALQESESRYRLLFDAIPESVMLIGTDGRVIAANRASARLYNYDSPQQLEGFYTPLLVAEKDRQRATKIQTELVQDEEWPPRQYTEVRRDGSEFVAEVMSTPLRGPQQEVLGHIGITRDITALVEAQDKLRQSNELLSAFVRNSPIYAFIKMVTPTESRVLQASDSYQQMIGLSASEMLGKTMGELFPAELAATMTADDWSVAATGQVLKLDEELNGRSYESIKFPVVLGDRTFLAGYTTDVTERKRAEAEILETTQRLQFALHSGHLGVWDWNLRTNIMVWDDEMLSLYGLTREQFTGGIEAWNQGLHPEDRERAIADCQAAIDGDRDFDTEFRVVQANGAVRHVKADGMVQRDAGGTPIRMLGLNQDVTGRKRTESALHVSETLLAAVVDSTSDLIWSVDSERFGLLSYNRGFQDYFHNHRGVEVQIGMRPEDLLSSENFIAVWHGLYRRALSEGPFATDYDGIAGPVALHLTVCLLRREGKVYGISVFGRDVTERQRAEAEKARLEAQLQQAQKMESVGRLAGGVAHDFNNMLGVILGCTELAMEQVHPSEPLRGSLEEIRTAAERSANLTRQLLAFARKQTVALKVLDLNETVASMLKMLHRIIGEDIALVWLPGEQLPPINVDPSQIDQILANLCVNARDAIGGVGKLTIETAFCAFGDDYCAMHAEVVPGEYVRLAVSDNGCGMDQATQDRLFEPFFTTKAMGKGTGLGLATVYGIVKQNNGFINVISEPGRGTMFEIYLPPHVADEIASAQSERQNGVATRGHETILVVEDEPAILNMTKMMLERLGYTVLTASTPSEASRLVSVHAGVVHLLVTDVVMPEMNGRDLAKHLLASYPGLKRLFMSGYTADVIAHHGVLDEGVHFIQKPFTKKELAAAVSEALERG